MNIRSWITSPLVRNFPRRSASPSKAFAVEAALNERFSFQVAMRHDAKDLAAAIKPVNIALETAAPSGWNVRVRRVGQVAVPHRNTMIPESDLDGWDNYPGYAPDPLFDENTIALSPRETQAFYVTVKPGRNATPGKHSIKLSLREESGWKASHAVTVTLHEVIIKKRKDFRVTNWFYADALIDYYKTDLFDKRFWEVLPNYFRDMAEHGQDTIYTPVFTPPLDGIKRPSQLLRVHRAGKDKYSFDWRDVKTYVDLAKRSGLDYFEWTHLFTQWGAGNAIRIYEGQGREEKPLWKPETGATSPTYRKFLGQFLPAFHRFLSEEKLLNKSFFHVSDEPGGEGVRKSYCKARSMLQELAPWIKTMDALSEIEYGREKLTDIPIPSIHIALDFVKENIPSWCYYCCGPRGWFLQRLLDTPLAKIRMNGWLFYRWPFQGFLHWGYNYWYISSTRQLIDPFSVQDGGKYPGWPYGDTFQVYPGPNGPIDSLRWEAFGDSLQDYALLQTLDVERNGKLLKDIRDFKKFPKDERWLSTARKQLFAKIK